MLQDIPVKNLIKIKRALNSPCLTFSQPHENLGLKSWKAFLLFQLFMHILSFFLCWWSSHSYSFEYQKMIFADWLHKNPFVLFSLSLKQKSCVKLIFHPPTVPLFLTLFYSFPFFLLQDVLKLITKSKHFC